MDGREIRLKRLFGEGRSVIVAMDHGLFDGPIDGMLDLSSTAQKISSAVDGVLLSPGMIRHCANVFAGEHRPLAVVRLNWNTVYCFQWNYRAAKSVTAFSVEEALVEGMDIALVSLTLQTGDEQRDAANVDVFCRLTNAAHRLGIPVIGEYFPTAHGEMSPAQLQKNVYIGSRIVAELGADAIKTFITEDFASVTGTCPIPVLGLGAEKLPTQLAALQLAQRAIQAGAGGVVFGRNAIQVPQPGAFQQALREVVKHKADPLAMVKQYKLD